MVIVAIPICALLEQQIYFAPELNIHVSTIDIILFVTVEYRIYELHIKMCYFVLKGKMYVKI